MLAGKRQILQSQPFPARFIKSKGFLSNMLQNIPESFTLRVLCRVFCSHGSVQPVRHPGSFYLTVPYGADFWGLFSKCKIIGSLAECAVSDQKKFSTMVRVSDVLLMKRWLQRTRYGHRSQTSRCIKRCPERKSNWDHLCNEEIQPQ